MLYILLIISVACILGQAWLLYIFINRITELSDQNEALEQGFAEVTDAYETDGLQYESSIEELNEELAKRDRANSEQMHTIESYQARSQEWREDRRHLIDENLGIRRQLDIAQTIISEHDNNCLPHIVLTSMEPDQETIPGI